MRSNSIHSAVPVISTADIRGSIEHYVNALGFSPDFEFGDPVVYAGVKSGDAEIYFSHDPEMSELIQQTQWHPEIFLWLSDVRYLYKKHIANGAQIVEELADRPWGARQYVVQDINGYRLKFAQPM